MDLSYIRPFDKQMDILKQIKEKADEVDENDEDFKNIKETIDFLLSDVVVHPTNIENNAKINKEEDMMQDINKEEIELTHKLEKLKIQVQFLTEKVEEKKNYINQCKSDNKKREAIFIGSLRSIRDQLCQKAESLKSDS